MPTQIAFIADGNVTSSRGFLAGATFAGLKTFGEQKLDLGILLSESPCTSAGIFTTNVIKASSLRLTEEYLQSGDIRAIVVNSGIANAGVGEQGLKDAREMSSLAASQLDLEPREVAICSTGLIGVELPMALIRAGLSKIKLSKDAGNAVARAMITTDTFHKTAAVTFDQDGKTITIGGVAKGSGMIHPNMATMLAFLTTDATVERSFLQKTLKEAADLSFNMISIDGDTSTNDTVLLLANGASDGEIISEGSPYATIFLEALIILSKHLAKEIVRDGEGATKIFSVLVEGARTSEEARLAARTVANSNLVKTAVHGNDPNWGRIIAAVGRSGAHIQENKIALYVNDVCIMEDGRPIPFFKDAVIAIMSASEVSFRVSLNLGAGEATAWGCDLSEEYVTFNSAYTT